MIREPEKPTGDVPRTVINAGIEAAVWTTVRGRGGSQKHPVCVPRLTITEELLPVQICGSACGYQRELCGVDGTGDSRWLKHVAAEPDIYTS